MNIIDKIGEEIKKIKIDIINNRNELNYFEKFKLNIGLLKLQFLYNKLQKEANNA